jgi:hypothetical protein
MNKFYSNFNDKLSNDNFNLFINTTSPCKRAKIIANILSNHMWYEDDKLYKKKFYKTLICDKDNIGEFIVTISRKLFDNSNSFYKRPQTDSIKKYLKRDEYYDIIQDILLLLTIDEEEEEECEYDEEEEEEYEEPVIHKTKKNNCKFESDNEEEEEEEEEDEEDEEDNIEIIKTKNGKKEIVCSLHDVAKSIARFKKL